MERGPRGPYLLLCGPVAAWAHFRAEWWGLARTRWKGKRQARMPLKNQGGPPGDPPANPRAPWLAVSGAPSQGPRNGCWGHGAGSGLTLWTGQWSGQRLLGSHASDVTAKGITTLTVQKRVEAEMCTKSRSDILHVIDLSLTCQPLAQEKRRHCRMGPSGTFERNVFLIFSKRLCCEQNI